MTCRILRVLSALLLAPLLAGQQGAPAKEKPVDPYTRGEPAALEWLGYASLGPFAVSPRYRTEDVDEVIGEDRILWIESRHFKIGSALEAIRLPTDRRARENLARDLRELARKLPRLRRGPDELDRWLRAHLLVHRCERLYEKFAELAGFDPDDTDAHLRSTHKLVVIAFQKTSSMSRFFARFTDTRSDQPVRFYDAETPMMALATAAEGFDGFLSRDETMWTHIAHNVVHIMIDACNEFRYDLPLWWEDGVAFWFVRQIDPRFPSVAAEDARGLDHSTVWNWPPKVRARVGHDYFPEAEELLRWTYDTETKYSDHMMMWSRVDYLMGTRPGGFPEFLAGMRGIPLGPEGVENEDLFRRQEKVLKEVYGLDPETFDEKWRIWVLRNYPEK